MSYGLGNSYYAQSASAGGPPRRRAGGPPRIPQTGPGKKITKIPTPNPIRPGNMLGIPEAIPNAPVPLAGGKAAAAANPGYQAGVGKPLDPIYDQQVGAAQRTRDDQLAYLANQRQAGLSSFGYTPDLQFDPNNPFSQAALLKRSYDQARSRTTNSIAAGGGLYSGALQNAQADVNFRQGAAQDALQKRLADFLAKNTQAQNQARNTYDTSVAGFAGDSVARTTGG